MKQIFRIILFSVLLSFVLSYQVSNLSEQVQIFQDIQNASLTVELQYGENTTYQVFSDPQSVISMRMVIPDQKFTKNLCTILPLDVKQQQKNTLNVLNPSQIAARIDESSNQSEVLTTMIQVRDGVVIFSSYGRLFAYQFLSKSINDFYEPVKMFESDLQTFFINSFNHSTQAEPFIPLMAYNQESSVLFLVGNKEIVYCKLDIGIKFIGGQSNFAINTTKAVAIATSQLYLYVATYTKIDIFNIDVYNGSLTYWMTFTDDMIPEKHYNVKFVDIKTGGKQGQYLYILDQANGVYILDVERNRIQIHPTIGTIPIQGGIKIDESQDFHISVLTQDSQGIKQIYEYGIDFFNSQWYLMNTFGVPQDSINVIATNQIALIQVQSNIQKIMFPAIYSNFLGEMQNSPSFQLTDIFSFGFFTPSIYNNYLLSAYNSSFNILFGIGTKQLITIPWQIKNPTVACFTNDHKDINKMFSYIFIANSTNCGVKQKYLAYYMEDFMLCNKTQQVFFKVKGEYQQEDNNTLMIVLLSVLIPIGVLLIAFGVWKYYKYSQEKKQIEDKIQFSGTGETPVKDNKLQIDQQSEVS